ncbi:chemotaxis protein CheA [soil metagenome]
MNTGDLDAGFIAQAMPAFISEAHEQIETLEQLLLELEGAPGDRDLLDALFRCVHTVKGSAGIFGLDAVVEFTHHVETLLDQVREGHVPLTPELSTLLLQSNDQIRTLIAAGGGAGDAPVQVVQLAQTAQEREAIVLRLKAACGSSAAVPEGAAPAGPTAAPGLVPSTARWHIAAAFGANTFRNGMDPLAVLNYVGRLGQISSMRCDDQAVPPLDTLDAESCHLAFEFDLDTAAGHKEIEAAFSFVRDDCALVISAPHAVAAEAPVQALANSAAPSMPGASTTPVAPKAPGAPAAPAVPGNPANAARPEEQRFIRVQADRLDEVINLLGELVIAGAGASLLARQSRQGTLIEANQQITRLIEEIRNGTLQLRMVPIGETFSRFRRVVRDTAAELGKDVALEIVGGETELDKSVVERIADPLMHLVRNALDHGLETPDVRQAEGKPAQGKLTLSACHESGSILIRIADNGRGIQRAKVLQRAWDRGLVEPGVTPADADIDKLIFEAGFSTAETVTNLSGRGVGMDVVRRNIEALRGSVSISSDTGKGSCIEIRLPLTLAIIDGFLVGVGSSRFIFPLDAVVEVIESAGTAASADAHGRSCVELRGHVLPVVDLRVLYDLDTPPPERCSVVVVRSGANRFGVLVDQLLGQHQTVIKPLGRLLGSLRGMSGSSILGTGEVALIFDVGSLGQQAAAQLPVTALMRNPSSTTAAYALPPSSPRQAAIPAIPN